MIYKGLEHPRMLGHRQRPMHEHGLFSVRETLLGPGEPPDRFHRCLVEAKRFIDETSVAGMLDFLFERQDNRYPVQAEASQMPPFMPGQPIASFDAGVAVICYEKSHGTGELRIDVLLPMDGASR